jgi:hypothetical protein
MLLDDPLDRVVLRANAEVRGSPIAGEVERAHREHRHAMTDPSTAAEPRWMVPRGLIVVLAMTGLLVSVLALQQFASILGPGPARAHPRHLLCVT